jgi:hypothetical protein
MIMVKATAWNESPPMHDATIFESLKNDLTFKMLIFRFTLHSVLLQWCLCPAVPVTMALILLLLLLFHCVLVPLYIE